MYAISASFGSVVGLFLFQVNFQDPQTTNHNPVCLLAVESYGTLEGIDATTAQKTGATKSGGSAIGDNHALLDVLGYRKIPLKKEKSLNYLKGAHIYERIETPKSGDFKAGMLEFTVRRGGTVFLAVNWEYDGSTSGGWTKERMLRGDFYHRGWLEVEPCPWDTKSILYYRACKTGEKLRIRNRKYGAPVVLTAPPVDFFDEKYRNRIPVKTINQLMDRRNLKLLGEKKFDELEKVAGPLRKKKTKFRNGDSILYYFYSGLSDADSELPRKVTDEDWEKRLRLLEAWQKAKPKSITPHILLAKCYSSYGHHARGSGWASTVSEKNAKMFDKRKRKAMSILLEADKAIRHNDPVLFSSLISIALGIDVPRRSIYAWAQKAVDLDPTFMATYSAMTIYLMPRWHGISGELEKFAEQISKKTKRECGMMAYAHIVRTIGSFARRKTFEEFRFSWEKTRQGFRDLEKKYPNSREHRDPFCYLACLSGDRKTALELFQRIGDGYRGDLWGYQNRYREWQYAFRPEIWEGEHRKSITAHEDGVVALDYSHDGKVIATSGLDKHIRLWDAKSGKKVFVTQPGDSWATCLDFSPKLRILAVGTGGGEVLLWDFANGRTGTLGNHKGRVRSVAFSSNGQLVASVGADNHTKVWSLKTGKLLKDVPESHKGKVFAVRFHPNGELLATVGSDGQFIMREATTGKITSQWNVTKTEITAIAFPSDGKRVATGDNKGTVTIWDIGKKQKLASIQPLDQKVQSLDFSPKSDRLAIAIGQGRFLRTGGAYVWTGKSDSKPRQLKGQKMAAMTVRFSPKGDTIATGSKDWSLRLWANK